MNHEQFLAFWANINLADNPSELQKRAKRVKEQLTTYMDAVWKCSSCTIRLSSAEGQKILRRKDLSDAFWQQKVILWSGDKQVFEDCTLYELK